MAKEQQAGGAGSARANLATGIASFLGAGFFPFAPATFTSLIVSLLLLLVGDAALAWRIGVLILVVLVGTWAAHRTEKRFGHDARCIVIDEVAGMLLSVLLIPWDLLHLGIAFFLFRAFDVLKPPPVRQLESLRGGLGIMADDVAAGLLTLLVLHVAGIVLPFL